MRFALQQGRPLSARSDAELAEQAPDLDKAAFRALLEGDGGLEAKVSFGGTSLARVREQLAAAREQLAAA